MNLLEEHKAERRGRILATARQIMAQDGYEGLSMRRLAKAARVSVPTLYNYFGSKQAILEGWLDENFVVVTTALQNAEGEGIAERMLCSCEAATDDLLEAPAYTRALVNHFLVATETSALRRSFEQGYVALLAAELSAARERGEVYDWVEPRAVAGRQFAHYMQVMIQWARGDFDDRTFRDAALLGLCLLLLGVTQGESAQRFEARARDLQASLISLPTTKTSSGDQP